MCPENTAAVSLLTRHRVRWEVLTWEPLTHGGFLASVSIGKDVSVSPGWLS